MTNQDDVNIAAENINNNQLTLTRRIRSFVLRQGRLTKGQEQALMTLWPKYGIEYSATSPIAFAQEKPIVLEIGFGMGASFIEMAASAKDKHFLGIEVHKPGVGACLMAIDERKLTNVNVMCHDAVEVLENSIMDNALDHVQIFFPDPWHKARHHKRRIIQPQFVKLVMQKLKSGGTLHLATDWQPYAEHMLTVLSETSGLQNVSKTGDYIPRPDTRPMTKFENRGQKLGHGVWDLQFMKLPNCK